MSAQEDAVKATSALARRAGCVQFMVKMSPIPVSTKWMAVATYPSGSEIAAFGTSPLYACDNLAIKLLDGSVCRRCNHVIATTGNDDTYCQWRRLGDVWAPGCGLPVNPDIEMVPRG